jgi:hypothetical protein
VTFTGELFSPSQEGTDKPRTRGACHPRPDAWPLPGRDESSLVEGLDHKVPTGSGTKPTPAFSRFANLSF